jgi:sugar lactone lactonase YvrE
VPSSLLASGLGFPEGPTILGGGRIVLCDGNTGELLAYENGNVSTYARTGGSPWGTVPGSDGALYVTQGGNVPGSGDVSAVSGIQRVNPDGTVELLVSEVAGYQLYGPNDLAFGPDGRLYFTESGSEQDLDHGPMETHAGIGPASDGFADRLPHQRAVRHGARVPTPLRPGSQPGSSPLGSATVLSEGIGPPSPGCGPGALPLS